MAETEVGKLNIKVGAKVDQIQKDMKRIEAQTKKSAKKIEKTMEKSLNAPFGKFVDTAVKSLAVMGTLEFGLRGVQGITKAFRGDWEGAQESLDQLPFGVGAFNRTLRETALTVTGITEEMDKQIKRQETLKKQMKSIKAINVENLDLDRQIADTRFAIEQMQRTPEVQAVYEIDRQLQETIRPLLARKAKIMGEPVRHFKTVRGRRRPTSEAERADVMIGRKGTVRKIDEAIAGAETFARGQVAKHVSGLSPEQQGEITNNLLKEIRNGLYLMSSGVPHGGPN